MSATPYGPLIDPIQPVMAPVPNIDPHLYYATETIRKIQEQYDRLKYQLSQKTCANLLWCRHTGCKAIHTGLNFRVEWFVNLPTSFLNMFGFIVLTHAPTRKR